MMCRRTSLAQSARDQIQRNIPLAGTGGADTAGDGTSFTGGRKKWNMEWAISGNIPCHFATAKNLIVLATPVKTTCYGASNAVKEVTTLPPGRLNSEEYSG
jgi:hypothetical protein